MPRTKTIAAALAGLWAGAALMFGVGLWCWPADHPGRTWATLPRPAAEAAPVPELAPADLIPPQTLPVPARPAGDE